MSYPRLRMEHVGSLHKLRHAIQTSQRTFNYFMSEVGVTWVHVVVPSLNSPRWTCDEDWWLDQRDGWVGAPRRHGNPTKEMNGWWWWAHRRNAFPAEQMPKMWNKYLEIRLRKKKDEGIGWGHLTESWHHLGKRAPPWQVVSTRASWKKTKIAHWIVIKGTCWLEESRHKARVCDYLIKCKLWIWNSSKTGSWETLVHNRRLKS